MIFLPLFGSIGKDVTGQFFSNEIKSAKCRLELNLFGVDRDEFTRDWLAAQSISPARFMLCESMTRPKRNRRNQLHIDFTLSQWLYEYDEFALLEPKDSTGPSLTIAELEEVRGSESLRNVSSYDMHISPIDWFSVDEEYACFQTESAELLTSRSDGGIRMDGQAKHPDKQNKLE